MVNTRDIAFEPPIQATHLVPESWSMALGAGPRVANRVTGEGRAPAARGHSPAQSFAHLEALHVHTLAALAFKMTLVGSPLGFKDLQSMDRWRMRMVTVTS